MRRALIACGGTGGHLSPGIALAEELISRGWKCDLLISRKLVDSRLVNKYSDLDYETLPGTAPSLNPIGFAKFAVNAVKGLASCIRMIRAKKPDVVVGFGGFMSISTLFAGYLAGRPVAIHESNRIPGRVTRLSGFFANRLYLPRGTSVSSAPASRIRPMGMPVRREIRPMTKSKAKQKFGFDPKMKLLVIVGGSQGARSLNEWVKANLESLAQEEIQVYCLTGLSGASNSEFCFRSSKGAEVRMLFQQFSDDMATVLSAADLVVSRSGAGSIAELIRCRCPSILIPYPYAADNHQLYNARYLEMRGGGILIDEEYLGSLLDEVRDTIYNDWLLSKFRENLALIDQVDAKSQMALDLEDLAQQADEKRREKIASPSRK